MSAILKVRQKDGTIIEIPALRGSDGKSAYEYAKEGGYTGTEEEFSNSLINGQSKGFLPSMNLNDLVSPGVYGISGVLTYENLPAGMTYGTLEVFSPNAGNLDFAIQRLSSFRGTAHRFYANSKWYDWRNEFNELNDRFVPKKLINNVTPSDGQTIGFSSNAKMLMVEVGNPSVNASIFVPNIVTTKSYIVTAVWDAGSNTYTRLTFKIVDGGLKVDTIYGAGNWATVTKYVSVYEVG